MSDAILELNGIVRNFLQPERTLKVLQKLSLRVDKGETVALIGQSGSGKSTLLHISGLLERPTAGDVSLAGQACKKMGDRERSILRLLNVGFVYQYHHLMPEFSALEKCSDSSDYGWCE